MENREYTLKENELDEIFRKELREAERALRNKKALALQPYKQERIKDLNKLGVDKGDIITDGNAIIKVCVINYEHSRVGFSRIEFYGTPLTKQLKPRKKQDEARKILYYGDGSYVTIVKKNETNTNK